MILIDANVFIAYYNLNEIHHQSAVSLWEKFEKGEYGEYFITDYVFNEVIGVTLRKLGKDHAILLGNKIIKSTFMLHMDEHLLQQAWNTFKETQLKLSLVDCTNLVALETAQSRSIATFDKEFTKIPSLNVIS